MDRFDGKNERSGPDADDRVQIEGCVRVLEHHLRGGGYALSVDGRTAEALVDWNGVRAGPPQQGNVLVDWHGRPQARRCSPTQFALAARDDAVRSSHSELIQPEHFLRPLGPPRLGRALATL